MNYTLKEQYNQLFIKFHDNSIEYVKKQNNYFHKTFNVNNNTGQIQKLGFSIENWFNNQSQITFQRIMYIKELAKQRKLKPIFLTLTTPSMFHPFKTYKRGDCVDNWDLNKNFGFDTIEESMKEGYSYLNNVWRNLYLNIKRGNRDFRELSKEILFIQTLEFHKSFIGHYHIVLFVPEKMTDWVEECYENVINEFGMSKKSNDFKYVFESEMKKDFDKYDKYDKNSNEYDGVVNYIVKYITKNLEDNNEDFGDFQRLMFGWKRSLGNRVRLIKSSNIPITLEVYKKVYYNLTEELKEELMKNVEKNNTCLLWEIEKITYYKKDIVNVSGEVVRSKEFNNKDKCKVNVYIKKEVNKTLVEKDDLQYYSNLIGCYIPLNKIEEYYNDLDIENVEYMFYYDMVDKGVDTESEEDILKFINYNFGEFELIYEDRFKLIDFEVKIDKKEVFNNKDWEVKKLFIDFEKVA